MTDLDIQAFSAAAGTAIRLTGRLDGNSAPDLEQQLDALVQNPGQPVILDLEHVSFVSSAGLRILLLLAKRTSQAKGSITVAHLQPAVKEVFEVSGFISLFGYSPSLAEALADNGLPADLCESANDTPSPA